MLRTDTMREEKVRMFRQCKTHNCGNFNFSYELIYLRKQKLNQLQAREDKRRVNLSPSHMVKIE